MLSQSLEDIWPWKLLKKSVFLPNEPMTTPRPPPPPPLSLELRTTCGDIELILSLNHRPLQRHPDKYVIKT